MLRLPPTLCPGGDARAIRLRCLVPPVLTLPALPQSHSHHIIAPRQFPLEIGFLFLFLFLLSCLVSSSLVLSVPLLCPTPCPSIARLIKSYSANLETNINLVEAINLHQSAPPTSQHHATPHHTTALNQQQARANNCRQSSSVCVQQLLLARGIRPDSLCRRIIATSSLYLRMQPCPIRRPTPYTLAPTTI